MTSRLQRNSNVLRAYHHQPDISLDRTHVIQLDDDDNSATTLCHHRDLAKFKQIFHWHPGIVSGSVVMISAQ